MVNQTALENAVRQAAGVAEKMEKVEVKEHQFQLKTRPITEQEARSKGKTTMEKEPDVYTIKGHFVGGRFLPSRVKAIHPSIEHMVPTLDKNFFFHKKSYSIVSDVSPSLLHRMAAEGKEYYEDNEHTIDWILENYQEGVKMFQPVAFTGHTGTGKTTLARNLAALAGQPFQRLAMNKEMQENNFVGSYVMIDGKSHYINGSIIRAYEFGIKTLLDEMDMPNPGLLAILNGILEGDAFLNAKKGGQVHYPHPEVGIYGAGNTLGPMKIFRHLYRGTDVPNLATEARFNIYVIDYMPAVLETEMVIKKCGIDSIEAPIESIQALYDSVAKMVAIANEVRESFKTGANNIKMVITPKHVIKWMTKYRTIASSKEFQDARGKILPSAYVEAAEPIFLNHMLKAEADSVVEMIKMRFGK